MSELENWKVFPIVKSNWTEVFVKGSGINKQCGLNVAFKQMQSYTGILFYFWKYFAQKCSKARQATQKHILPFHYLDLSGGIEGDLRNKKTFAVQNMHKIKNKN